MKLIAYETSKCVGETEWGIRTLDHEPRSAVHVAPSTAVTCRSPSRNQEAPAASFVDVLYRVEGDTVFITVKRVEPVKLRSGTRSLLALVFNAKSHNYRVRFRCDCGRKDHMSLDWWYIFEPNVSADSRAPTMLQAMAAALGYDVRSHCGGWLWRHKETMQSSGNDNYDTADSASFAALRHHSAPDGYA